MEYSFQKNILRYFSCTICLILLFQCGDENAPNSPGKIKGQWIKINNGLTDHHIQAITIDPNNLDVLLVASFEGIFKSTDGGSSWQLSNTGLLSKDVKVLEFDPLNSNKLYAGSWGTGIYCSEDGGTNWRAINSGITDKRIRAIVIHPDSTNQVYAASETEFLKSNDAGKMWSATKWPSGNISALAINFQSQIIFIGTGFNGIFRSTMSRENWIKINTGLPQASPGFYQNIDFLQLCPRQDASIYSALEGVGIFFSQDSGATWQPRRQVTGGWFYRCLIIHKNDPNFLIAGTSGGAFLSKDGGQSWEEINQGLENRDIRALTLRYDPLVIYAGTMGGGVFKYLLD